MGKSIVKLVVLDARATKQSANAAASPRLCHGFRQPNSLAGNKDRRMRISTPPARRTLVHEDSGAFGRIGTAHDRRNLRIDHAPAEFFSGGMTAADEPPDCLGCRTANGAFVATRSAIASARQHLRGGHDLVDHAPALRRDGVHRLAGQHGGHRDFARHRDVQAKNGPPAAANKPGLSSGIAKDLDYPNLVVLELIWRHNGWPGSQQSAGAPPPARLD